MPAAEQTVANRTNSQESTAPRIPHDRSASRPSAVMFDESADFAAGSHKYYSPADPTQRRCMLRVEAERWKPAANTFLARQTGAGAFRLPNPIPGRRNPPPPLRMPCNPNNPKPLVRNWFRSVKIWKAHLLRPPSHRTPRLPPAPRQPACRPTCPAKPPRKPGQGPQISP
jgi:hypothetical protein